MPESSQRVIESSGSGERAISDAERAGNDEADAR
jgi:hypothetical protein